MTELENALNRYLETKGHAELNLDEVPFRVRPGRESQKRQAQADLEGIKKVYENELAKHTFGVMVFGSNPSDFVKIATEEAEVLVVDGNEIFNRITAKVTTSMGTAQEFGVTQFGMVIRELRDIASELNIVSMPSPKWSEPASVASHEGLLKHITDMVNSSGGVELLAYYVGRQITDAGLKAKANKNVVPVIVTGLDAQTANALGLNLFAEGRQVFVNTPQEVTKDYVLNTFNLIKKQLKQNKENQPNNNTHKQLK